MLSVFDTTYHVSYSESHAGNVHGINSANEGYHYCSLCLELSNRLWLKAIPHSF